MSEWHIPDYWLTGLGSWALSYLLHSSVILGAILLLTYTIGRLSESNKDVLLKIGLIAGILTASIQFIQSSNGVAIDTMVMSIKPTQPGSAHTSYEVGRVLSSDGLQLIIPEAPPPIQNDKTQVNWLQVLLLGWLAGSALSGLRFLWLWRQFKRQTGLRRPLDHEPTIRLCHRLTRQMALKREIRLTCSDNIISPMAVGLSEVCIPNGLWQEVDQEQLTAIIAHELAHLSRTDPLWLFFWHLVGVVFFFQPLNRLTRLSFQSRAEFLADAIAVRQTKDPVAMVNSLLSTARLVGSNVRSNLANSLLGHNATLVARSKMLLVENPLKTRTPLPLIFLMAFGIVAMSIYWLPNVSLSSPQEMPELPPYGQLNRDNADKWQLKPDTRLNFKSNIDYYQAIAGVNFELRTRLVTFDYGVDDIADIEPGGQLRFSSRSIYSSRFLVIEADWSGNIWYRYQVDGESVHSQAEARRFIEKMLDESLGKSDEFKRNMLRLYIGQGHISSKRNTEWLVKRQLSEALTGRYLSEKDRALAKALLEKSALFGLGQAYNPASGLKFFNAMAYSGTRMASFNDFGYLALSSKRHSPGEPSIQYNLNNGELLRYFAQASGQSYVPGVTEKALVHFLVRLYFKVPEQLIRWLEE